MARRPDLPGAGEGPEGAELPYREKAVRDLAWLLSAPPLLTPATGLDLLAEPEDEAVIANNRFNNLHFRISLETKHITTCFK